MKLEDKIDLAIERLYVVFLPYKRRDKIEGCYDFLVACEKIYQDYY